MVKKIERIIAVALLVMMLVAVFVGTIELGVILVRELWNPPRLLLDIDSMLEIFGFFLMVLIGLELLETIKIYLGEQVLHAEVVMLVAIVAVSRKIILLDYEKWTASMAVGAAAALLALATGYFLVKRAVTFGSGSRC